MLVDFYRRYYGFQIDAQWHRVFYGADTAYHERWAGLGPVDLAIVAIGAYDPYIYNHTNPEQAWAMSKQLEARHVLPVHHSTFIQSREPVDEPLQRLLAAAGEEEHRIVVLEIGGAWTL